MPQANVPGGFTLLQLGQTTSSAVLRLVLGGGVAAPSNGWPSGRACQAGSSASTGLGGLVFGRGFGGWVRAGGADAGFAAGAGLGFGRAKSQSWHLAATAGLS